MRAFGGVCPKCGGDIYVQAEVWEYPEFSI